jgi:regulatory protein
MEAAGKLLAVRARSESELRDRLLAKEFPEDEIEAALTRLRELRLIDDAAFAADWVEQRATSKGLGPDRLRIELKAKGIAREVIDAALAECGTDHLAKARELAAQQIRKVVHLPLPRQAARLQGFLARRGFSAEVVDSAVRAVLPPEGWD